MNSNTFTVQKEVLISLLKEHLAQTGISEQNKIGITKLLVLLNHYSFENRLQQKGLLSHTIIDSLELDYSLAEKLIQFDHNI